MTFDELLSQPTSLLALAPMQDITDLPFWKLISNYGGPDVFFTEFFRVTENYRPERHILRSLTDNPTGRPAIAQIIGNDPKWMARTARELSQYPVVAIDLNLGCPAPVVYRKCAGGGLLRDPARMDALLGSLREAIPCAFTVKTRLGFQSDAEFDQLLAVFAKHDINLLTVHGRTVAEKYGPIVHYDRIAQAVQALPCPVLANGNVSTPIQAESILQQTGARGLMVGRGAIRNPWIFEQIRSHLAGSSLPLPTGSDILAYIEALYAAVCSADFSERQHIQKMKKYLNFLGEGLGTKSGEFLHAIRRSETHAGFFAICHDFLNNNDPHDLCPATHSDSLAAQERLLFQELPR